MLLTVTFISSPLTNAALRSSCTQTLDTIPMHKIIIDGDTTSICVTTNRNASLYDASRLLLRSAIAS